MGLATSHRAWSGPYSSFSRWRNAIARADGIVVDTIPDEQLGTVHESYVLDWDAREIDDPEPGELVSFTVDGVLYVRSQDGRSWVTEGGRG